MPSYSFGNNNVWAVCPAGGLQFHTRVGFQSQLKKGGFYLSLLSISSMLLNSLGIETALMIMFLPYPSSQTLSKKCLGQCYLFNPTNTLETMLTISKFSWLSSNAWHIPWCCLLIHTHCLWGSEPQHFSVANSFTLQLTSLFIFTIPLPFLSPVTSENQVLSTPASCNAYKSLFTVLQSRGKDSHFYCFFSSLWRSVQLQY